MKIDHEALLRRYIAHVMESEGSTFIGGVHHIRATINLTREEIAELERLEALDPAEEPATCSALAPDHPWRKGTVPRPPSPAT